MKKFVLLILVAISLYGAIDYYPALLQSVSADDNALINAFNSRKSNIQVIGSGVVIKKLADDNKGSRHQRFILRLSSGQTVLIAHNIDLAARINSLEEGDVVSFNGEYEWNKKGGVVHWTHRDPSRRHEDGWLQHKGVRYQ